MNTVIDREKRGDGPQFELAFPAADDGGLHGDNPLIRVSSRARRLSLRVYPDARVEMVVPPRAHPREVEAFLAAHREWIEAKRALALRNRPTPQVFPPAAIHFEHIAPNRVPVTNSGYCALPGRLRLPHYARHYAAGCCAPRARVCHRASRHSRAIPAFPIRRWRSAGSVLAGGAVRRGAPSVSTPACCSSGPK